MPSRRKGRRTGVQAGDCEKPQVAVMASTDRGRAGRPGETYRLDRDLLADAVDIYEAPRVGMATMSMSTLSLLLSEARKSPPSRC